MPSSTPLGLTEFDPNSTAHKEDFSPLQLSVPQSHLLHHASRKSGGVSLHQSSHSLLSPSPNLLQTPNVFKVPQDRDSPRPAFGSTEFDPCTSAKTRGPAEPSTLWSLVAPSPTTFALSPGLWSASPKLLSPLSATFPKFRSDGPGMFGETHQHHHKHYSNDSSIAADGASASTAAPHDAMNTTTSDSSGASGAVGANVTQGGSEHAAHQQSSSSQKRSAGNQQKKSSTQRSTSSTQAASCDTPTLKNIQMKMQQQKEQYRNNMNRNGVVAQSVESVYSNMSQFQQQNMRQQGAPMPTDQAQYTQHLARLCAQLSQHQDPQQMMNSLTQGQAAQGGSFPEPKGNDVQFHIKPARKNMDSFVSNTPRDLYSQPYKYDIRIVIPAHIRDHYVLKMQLCVEKTKQYIAKNHKNESTLIIERVIEKEHKGEAIFNYRVVFNACSFHFSKSLFSLHLFLIPKVRVNADQQDATNTNAAQLDTSGYEPVWRSIPFEMYARKVNPRQWPSEQEIQERLANYINDQTRSAQNFLGTPFAMAAQQLAGLQQGAADPAHLTQLVSSAIQHRQQQQQQMQLGQFVSPGAQQRPMGAVNPQQMQQHMMASGYFPQQHGANASPPMHLQSQQSQQSGESLSDSEGSPSRKNNKRKRNLQIDTQFSKRQKTGSGEALQSLHM